MNLKDIGEFGLIHRFAPQFLKDLPRNVEGIGDDCAIIPTNDGKSTLVTTDMLIENVHFIRSQISPFDLGYKSLAVNLSDIAAMGGVPLYAFLSIGLTSDLDLSWIDSFFNGMAELAKKEHVYLLGGDTTRSKSDLVINITLIGEMDSAKIKRRSQAKVGDVICCTGPLGDSGAGLQVLLNHLPEDALTHPLIIEHHHPKPHLKEGQWLANHPAVHAMIDVSDGIDSDLKRIMESSQCGAKVDLESLPVSTNLKLACDRYDWNIFDLAASAGEDYCLAATISKEEFPAISKAFQSCFGAPLYEIGEITNDKQLIYTLKGKAITLKKHGFDHFHHR